MTQVQTLPRRSSVRGLKGAARRKAQTYGVRIRCRIRRAPSGAPHSLLRYRASRYLSAIAPGALSECSFRGVFCVTHRAPLSVAGYGRSVSQLLAGTRSGPGGSPGAARVARMRCEPRGRRAPSRFGNASRKRPSLDEVRASVMEDSVPGISFPLLIVIAGLDPAIHSLPLRLAVG
jgi:hypothetical protein